MDIHTVLKEWEEAKRLKTKVTKQCEKYKQAIEVYMDRKGVDSVSTPQYVCSRRKAMRHHMTRASTPRDVWDRYATTTQVTSYYLRPNRKVSRTPSLRQFSIGE